MLLAQTFEAGICDKQLDIELKYISMIPVVIKVIGAPILLICLMGLFFTYLISMSCTMSILRIEKKGEKYVISYLIYRLAFAIVLKGVELFMLTWWSQFGIFEKCRFHFRQHFLIRKVVLLIQWVFVVFLFHCLFI